MKEELGIALSSVEPESSQVDSTSSTKHSKNKGFMCRDFFRNSYEKHRKKIDRSLGMLLAASSGLLLTVYSSVYKLIKTEIDISTVLMIRGLIQITVMTIIITMKGASMSPTNTDSKTRRQKVLIWIFFICLCIVGGLRLCFIFSALERIPMALVHTILNGSPIVVMVLSHFLLHDICNILRIFCTCALVIGVFLIFQPYEMILDHIQTNTSTFQEDAKNCQNRTNETAYCSSGPKVGGDLPGYIFSAGALVFSAAGSVLTKRLTEQFNKMVISLYLGISISIIAWLQLIAFGAKAPTSPDSMYPWIMAFVVGALGVAQQFCLIAALKLESPTRVTMIRSLQIVASFIVQVQVWNERPSTDQIIGAVVVLSAICLVTLEKPILEKMGRRSSARIDDVIEGDDKKCSTE